MDSWGIASYFIADNGDFDVSTKTYYLRYKKYELNQFLGTLCILICLSLVNNISENIEPNTLLIPK